MSSTIKLYTWGSLMENVVFDTVTSEATGFEKEHLIDGNLDTMWKPTSTADQNVEFDFGSGNTVLPDYCVFFLHNYTLVANGVFIVDYSDDGAAWFNASTGFLLTGGSTPIRLDEITEGSAHRYWRIMLSSLSGVLPQVSAVWFSNEYDLGHGNEWPENDIDRFHNKVVKLGGGREHTIAVNRRSRKVLPRIFLFDGLTDITALQNANQESGGNRWPLVYYDGVTYRVVKFDSRDFNIGQVGYQRFEPMVTFRELPYVESGEVY